MDISDHTDHILAWKFSDHRKPGIARPTCCPALGPGLPLCQNLPDFNRIGQKDVQEHIQEFGGDPSLVTLGGISAGAASTHYLLLSKVVAWSILDN